MAGPNLSFLSELMASIGRSIGSLAGWQKATHEEVQATRKAVESGGRFNVLEGLPAGSNNARSITAMLSGMKTPPPTPRVRSPLAETATSKHYRQTYGNVGGEGEQVAQDIEPVPRQVGRTIRDAFRKLFRGNAGTVDEQSQTDSLPRLFGRAIGGIFRRITGTGAVNAAGETSMTGSLAIRGGAAALGAAGVVKTAAGLGLAVYGVSRALQGFGEQITEQSQPLRRYSAQTNVAFTSLERQKDILANQKATSTAPSLQFATQAAEEARRALLPIDVLWTKIKNYTAGGALKGAAVGFDILSGIGSAIAHPFGGGWGKTASDLEEAERRKNLTPDERKKEDQERAAEQKQKERDSMTAWGQITESLLRPDRLAKPLRDLHGTAASGLLAQQQGFIPGMMGLNPAHPAVPQVAGAAGPGAAFDPAQLAVAKNLVIPRATGPNIGGRGHHKRTLEEYDADKEAKRKAYDAAKSQRAEAWVKAHEGRAHVKQAELDVARHKRVGDAARAKHEGRAHVLNKQPELDAARHKRVGDAARAKAAEDDAKRKAQRGGAPLEEQPWQKELHDKKNADNEAVRQRIREIHAADLKRAQEHQKNRPELLKVGELP